MKDTRRAFWLTRKIVFMYVLTISPISYFLQPLPQLSTTRTHPPSSEYHRRHSTAPSSRSGARLLLGFRALPWFSSQPIELQELPAQRVMSHEPAIGEVPEGRDNWVSPFSVFTVADD